MLVSVELFSRQDFKTVAISSMGYKNAVTKNGFSVWKNEKLKHL